MKSLLTLEEAAAALKTEGAVGVIPTDTVYGLVARAADRKAVARLYALKHREHKPGTVIAASVEQLVELGVPAQYLKRVGHLWPNPVSVILPVGDELGYIHQGLGDFPVRIPNDLRLIDVLKQTGPLVTSSANQPGQPPAHNVHEATGYFRQNVDFYADGGTLTSAPSTIVKLTSEGYEVIRDGAVKVS